MSFAREVEIANACYWMREQGASEDTVELAVGLGRAWNMLPDAAVMKFVNEIVERTGRQLTTIVEEHDANHPQARAA